MSRIKCWAVKCVVLLEDLQEGINKISEDMLPWFENNNLLVNKSKSVAVIFQHKANKKTDWPTLSLDASQLTYATHSKFLGVYVDNNLSWDVHIDNLSTKLSKQCYMLYSLRHSVNFFTLKTIYYAYFHSLLHYGIIFWGRSTKSIQIFKLQKRAIRTMMMLTRRTSCKQYFKDTGILPFPCIYIYEILVHVKLNLHKFLKNTDIHNYDTRNNSKFCTLSHNTTLFEHSFEFSGTQLYNILPEKVKQIESIKKFKQMLHSYLIEKRFYSVAEYVDLNT